MSDIIAEKMEKQFRYAQQLIRKLAPTAKRVEVVMNLYRPVREVECRTCGGKGKLPLPLEPLITHAQALKLLEECWPPREGEAP